MKDSGPKEGWGAGAKDMGRGGAETGPFAPMAYTGLPFQRSSHLAKPNYSFEKRQREIAKKKKQDEKDAKKRAEREAAKAAAEPGRDPSKAQ